MQVRVNGQWTEIPEKTSAFALREKIERPEEIVVVLNGFQLKTDHELRNDDQLFLIPKGALPEEHLLEMMIAARHTPGVYERLKHGVVGIAGLGGLGSHIAFSLARSGVGTLVLADYDIVEPSNLNRQNYLIRHLGHPKTEALAEQLLEINPYMRTETHHLLIQEKDVRPLFGHCHVLCEAFDDPAAKAMLVSAALRLLPGVKIISGSGMAGYESSNTIRTKKQLDDLYICGDGENEACFGRGLMAPRVQICAGHQANMAIRLLLGIEEV